MLLDLESIHATFLEALKAAGRIYEAAVAVSGIGPVAVPEAPTRHVKLD